jgi:putative flippase GtrA
MSAALPARLRRHLVRFSGVGLVSTAAYASLYWVLRGRLPEAESNTIALLVTAVANTAANRRVTFGVRGSHGLLRDHAGGLIAFAVAFVLTNVAVIGMHLMSRDPAVWLEIAVLTLVNLIATAVRFVIFRNVLFHLRRLAEAKLVTSPAD